MCTFVCVFWSSESCIKCENDSLGILVPHPEFWDCCRAFIFAYAAYDPELKSGHEWLFQYEARCTPARQLYLFSFLIQSLVRFGALKRFSFANGEVFSPSQEKGFFSAGAIIPNVASAQIMYVHE